MSEESKTSTHRGILDRWAQTRFLRTLSEVDPLTARRLPLMLEEGLTMEELVALEDEGFEQLAHLIVEGTKERGVQEDSPHDSLTAKGFETGSTVSSFRPNFTVEDMKASAFDTRYSTPRTIPVELDGFGTVQVAITMLRLKFNDGRIENETDGHGYYEVPDWYLEGWVVDGASTYHDQHVRVRAYAYPVGFDNPEGIDVMEIQIIPD